MLWPVFSWEVRLDHCNGPSRSLARWCLISFLTLNYAEKRRFLRNKWEDKNLHEYFAGLPANHWGVGGERRCWSNLVNLAEVNGAVLGVWNQTGTGAGDGRGLILSLAGLGNAATHNCPSSAWFVSSSATVGNAWGSCLHPLMTAVPEETIHCLFSCPNRRLLELTDSSNVLCQHIMAQHKPELVPDINSLPSIAKALSLCASICHGYSALKACVCVWWWVTKVRNIL